MRPVLSDWIVEADVGRNRQAFGIEAAPPMEGRANWERDLYISLIGDLFDAIRGRETLQSHWMALGNALGQLGESFNGRVRSEAYLFAATAFYNGGYSASALLTMRQADPSQWTDDAYRACHDLLARPALLSSELVPTLISAIRQGERSDLQEMLRQAQQRSEEALQVGPDAWIAAQTYAALLRRFSEVNVRAALPDGYSTRWDPLVNSFLEQSPPVWDFFPSQLEAIAAGLLTSPEPYSLQMPTGAGKTALSETLIFSHLTAATGVAVLLVPYRALARELRGSLARRLGAMGLNTRTIYGGTVPTSEERRELEDVRVIIATPESLSGLLSTSPDLFSRVSLVIVDEGHLLDSGERGVGLELLLARFRGRGESRPRIVFLSAIVPNMAEINAWLGGTSDTTVTSTFRPAIAEFGVLRPKGTGRNRIVDIEMHTEGTANERRSLDGVLQVTDFEYVNPESGLRNTFNYGSVKTQAVAVARKALSLGSVAVFAANKTGDRGAVGLAEELLTQTEVGIPLPEPASAMSREHVHPVVDYLRREYGEDWVGTRSLAAGAVLHHGDLPQETREGLEELLAARHVRLVFCTSTLAEGINLPLRTIVLYAVRRGTATGARVPMLARDIQNLVGRAGRPASSTMGLVVCANPNEWELVKPVAAGEPGEDLHGFLTELLARLRNALRDSGVQLTNEAMESTPELHSLVDGVDTALLELMQEELDEGQFLEAARNLAEETLAWQTSNLAGRTLLSRLMELRSERITALRENGRLRWVVETGARVRLVPSILDDLAPRLDRWVDAESLTDSTLIGDMVDWAMERPELQRALERSYQGDSLPSRRELEEAITNWISGATFEVAASELGYPVDKMLRVHSAVIGYALQTLVDQAIAVLTSIAEEAGQVLPSLIQDFPQHLRFGVGTPAGRALMAAGVRHRRAAVLLGRAPELAESGSLFVDPVAIAGEIIQDEDRWAPVLGPFVYRRTVADLT